MGPLDLTRDGRSGDLAPVVLENLIDVDVELKSVGHGLADSNISEDGMGGHVPSPHGGRVSPPLPEIEGQLLDAVGGATGALGTDHDDDVRGGLEGGYVLAPNVP